jgi:hypothetical protein
MKKETMSPTVFAQVVRRLCVLLVTVSSVAVAAAPARGQALDQVKLGDLDCAVPPPEVRMHTLQAGEKFAGKKYGSGEGQLVCTTYARGVLEEAGYRVTKLGDQVINIRWGWSTEQIEEAVENNDPKAAGVVYYLLASGQGEAVEDIAKIRKGDFVQYWRWLKNKKTGNYAMAGHTAQVAAVLGEGKVRLHGSHLSAGGVGLITVDIRPTQRKQGEPGMYRTYVARPVENQAFEK